MNGSASVCHAFKACQAIFKYPSAILLIFGYTYAQALTFGKAQISINLSRSHVVMVLLAMQLMVGQSPNWPWTDFAWGGSSEIATPSLTRM